MCQYLGTETNMTSKMSQTSCRTDGALLIAMQWRPREAGTGSPAGICVGGVDLQVGRLLGLRDTSVAGARAFEMRDAYTYSVYSCATPSADPHGDMELAPALLPSTRKASYKQTVLWTKLCV